jgi:hypothetical protein
VKQTDFGKKISEKSSERTEAAKEVAVQAISALAKVYESLETAGLALIGDLSQATVKVVSHKYGEEAGSATEQGLGVVGDVSTTTVHMRRVGIRAIAKATVMESSKRVLRDGSRRRSQESKQDEVFPSAAMGAVMAMSEIQQAITGQGSSSSTSNSSSFSSSKPKVIDVD